MQTNHEMFFNHQCFAVVGHSSSKPFPKITYAGLKKLGKKVFPVDPGAKTIEGDTAYPDLASVPERVDAVLVEVPKAESAEWVKLAAELGVKDLWLHMNTETPEALEIAKKHNINLRTGTCAVMYVTPGLSFHSIHKWVMKLRKKY